MPPHAGLQRTIAFSFLMLGREAGSWVSLEHLAPRVWLPFAVDPPTEFEEKFGGTAPLRTGSRLLKPLVGFGLLESRDRPAANAWDRPYEVRKSALFDTFLRFDLDADPGNERPMRVAFAL